MDHKYRTALISYPFRIQRVKKLRLHLWHKKMT